VETERDSSIISEVSDMMLLAVTEVAEVVGHKDVVVAMLGASAALGGLTLVFLGTVVASYQAVAKETTENVKEPYKKAACRLLLTFGASLLSAAIASAWMVSGELEILYAFTIAFFFIQLALIAVMAPLTVYKNLLN
jgi:hypothetical protein